DPVLARLRLHEPEQRLGPAVDDRVELAVLTDLRLHVREQGPGVPLQHLAYRGHHRIHLTTSHCNSLRSNKILELAHGPHSEDRSRGAFLQCQPPLEVDLAGFQNDWKLHVDRAELTEAMAPIFGLGIHCRGPIPTEHNDVGASYKREAL